MHLSLAQSPSRNHSRNDPSWSNLVFVCNIAPDFWGYMVFECIPFPQNLRILLLCPLPGWSGPICELVCRVVSRVVSSKRILCSDPLTRFSSSLFVFRRVVVVVLCTGRYLHQTTIEARCLFHCRYLRRTISALNHVSPDKSAENQIQLGGEQYKNPIPEECMSTIE